MKKVKLWTKFVALLCVAALVIPTFAADTRASDQISMYYMDVSTSKGYIDVEFSIKGTGTVDKLGCQSIYIYERSGDGIRYVQSVLEDDEGMSASNTFTHSNLISCSAKAGVQYEITVTLFAENSAGRDTRYKTFYVTGE